MASMTCGVMVDECGSGVVVVVCTVDGVGVGDR